MLSHALDHTLTPFSLRSQILAASIPGSIALLSFRCRGALRCAAPSICGIGLLFLSVNTPVYVPFCCFFVARAFRRSSVRCYFPCRNGTYFCQTIPERGDSFPERFLQPRQNAFERGVRFRSYSRGAAREPVGIPFRRRTFISLCSANVLPTSYKHARGSSVYDIRVRDSTLTIRSCRMATTASRGSAQFALIPAGERPVCNVFRRLCMYVYHRHPRSVSRSLNRAEAPHSDGEKLARAVLIGVSAERPMERGSGRGGVSGEGSDRASGGVSGRIGAYRFHRAGCWSLQTN